MALSALREDALSSTLGGFAVRLTLPWIRSLPLASLRDVAISVDGVDVSRILVRLSERVVPAAALADIADWWFLQDRVVLVVADPLPSGAHDVTIAFRLVIPYLPAGPDGPLVLPFEHSQRLVLDAGARTPSVSRDVA